MSDLLDDYNRGGFGGALQPGKKPALLLVDVVVAYLTPGQPSTRRASRRLSPLASV
ncbi:hypothetical protein ACFSLT_25800 [Novosphingobium resinovorum]